MKVKAEQIIQIELLLNFVNILFAKAVSFKDVEMIDVLHKIRRGIYYDNEFNYESILEKLKGLDLKLKDRYS